MAVVVARASYKGSGRRLGPQAAVDSRAATNPVVLVLSVWQQFFRKFIVLVAFNHCEGPVRACFTMGDRSSWVLDLALRELDHTHWHVYRVAIENEKWEYEEEKYLRQQYPESKELLALLNSPPQPVDVLDEGNETLGPPQQIPNLTGLNVVPLPLRKGVFAPGNVFRTYWCQPKESGDPLAKERMFVVIRRDHCHSLCMAIHTYGGRGTTDRCVRPQDHVIIHAGEEAKLMQGEKRSVLNKKPIKFIPDPPRNADPDLLPSSRINFRKIYTIEHNIPVAKVGKISDRDVVVLSVYAVAQPA